MKAPPLKMIFLLLVLFVVVVCSCAHNPKTFSKSDSFLKDREEYVQAHPDGIYNKHIIEGEIVKGMSPTDVLVSWGLPNKRQHSENDTYVFWTYYTVEEPTGEITQYELIFRQQALFHWKVLLGPPDGGFTSRDPNLPVTLGQTEKESKISVLRK
jgi:hypothetical protein